MEGEEVSGATEAQSKHRNDPGCMFLKDHLAVVVTSVQSTRKAGNQETN